MPDSPGAVKLTVYAPFAKPFIAANDQYISAIVLQIYPASVRGTPLFPVTVSTKVETIVPLLGALVKEKFAGS